MPEFNEFTVTQAVVDRLAECADPRLKQIMTSLVNHVHDFVRDVRLTEEEWFVWLGKKRPGLFSALPR